MKKEKRKNNNNKNDEKLDGVEECVGERSNREEAKKMEENKRGPLVSLPSGWMKKMGQKKIGKKVGKMRPPLK